MILDNSCALEIPYHAEYCKIYFPDCNNKTFLFNTVEQLQNLSKHSKLVNLISIKIEIFFVNLKTFLKI